MVTSISLGKTVCVEAISTVVIAMAQTSSLSLFPCHTLAKKTNEVLDVEVDRKGMHGLVLILLHSQLPS